MDVLVRALRDFYVACLAPHWRRIVATYRAEVDRHTPALTVGGLAGVLGTLHDDLSWCDDALVRVGRASRFDLGGRGLQILPSALRTGFPVFAAHATEHGGNALIYPMRYFLADDRTGQPPDLTGLLGSTRAAVLDALRTPRSTRELAASVRTSEPTASEHAAALRAAGLVRTVRSGRSVSHSLTTLGRSLLNATVTS
jgi:DNA-binding transcriptional ArsR family regulator